MDNNKIVVYKFWSKSVLIDFNSWRKHEGDLLYNATEQKRNIIKNSVKVIKQTDKSITFECKLIN
jgi:hypothetical protein